MRVLVVDDHQPTIELMELALSAFGHTVVSATGILEALELVGSHRPDVVLCDLIFAATTEADQDGYTFARAVRANPDWSDVGLLAISGVTSPGAIRRALDAGFSDVVSKPFDISALVERLKDSSAGWTE